ncbi:MAG TPA: response regulator [Saprospiraceae bacterium]|nr:response regulator [Saprospiraceae bacterium]
MNTKFKTPILLVEDNPADANLIKIYLEDVGFKFELYTTDTLREAIEIIETKEIELALLDLTLGDISGFKTLSKFLESAAHVPVIVLTGLNNEIIGNQAIKAGAQDFLVKDQFDSKQLGRAIRYAMQRFKTQAKLKELARNLSISESRYQEAQELAHFGSWEMDIVSNSMKWSDEMFRIFGFQPGTLDPSFSDYLNFTHREDRHLVESFFDNANKSGALERLEHRIIVGGKSIKFLSLQAKMHFDEFTDRVLLVGAVQDISERKLSEQLLFEKHLTSESVKMQEETLHHLGFQVRTPLNSVINLLYLLDKTSANTQQREYIKDLKTSVDDLSLVVNDLLNFSLFHSAGVQSREQEVNVQNFIQGLEKLLLIRAENLGVKISLESSEKLSGNLVFDATVLQQVLFNLVDFSMKNMEKEETIRVDINTQNTSDHDKELDVRIKFRARNFSELSGFLKSESLPLQQNKPENDETRRSQANWVISKRLLKTLEGKLRQTENESENEVIFSILMPVKTILKTERFSDEKPSAPLHILLVEDHLLNQISTRKILTSWSEFVQVDIADNGKIALEKFDRNQYDLILMDIQMPVMNGLEAAREIRTKSSTPIIALTANATKQELENCLEAGMNDYISKPFKPEDLYHKILNLMILVAG